jgi:pimeloyl-ACP methyl ester carboxylesterase
MDGLINRYLKLVLFVSIVMLMSSCAKTTKINTENSIASLEKINLNGVNQWILIRGDNADNPILLFLHGGPGSPEMPANHHFGHRLEKDFVVVNWDQRGAGKSAHVSVPHQSMNVDQFVDDCHDLVTHLCDRFDKDKIYLVGHSWGSVLGTLTVAKYPGLFHAYVGIGQVVDLERNEAISYQYVVDKAEEKNNALAKSQLKMIGPPPYSNNLELLIQRQWLSKFGGAVHDPKSTGSFYLTALKSPEYSPADYFKYLYGTISSISLMWDEVMTYNFIEQAPSLEVPVYFAVGRHDYNTPWELTVEYYEVLDAKKGKSLIWFENSAHSPNLEEPEAFHKMMVERVLAETR